MTHTASVKDGIFKGHLTKKEKKTHDVLVENMLIENIYTVFYFIYFLLKIYSPILFLKTFCELKDDWNCKIYSCIHYSRCGNSPFAVARK